MHDCGLSKKQIQRVSRLKQGVTMARSRNILAAVDPVHRHDKPAVLDHLPCGLLIVKPPESSPARDEPAPDGRPAGVP